MPIALAGLPDNCVPVAYRRALAEDYWFSPSEEDGKDGSVYPGPSKDIVLVVVPATGYTFRYNIELDMVLIVEDEAVAALQHPAIRADMVLPLRAHSLLSFERISAKLLSGQVKRAARAMWKQPRWITVDPAHAPHFTTDAGLVWAYRADDLRARDWQILE